METACNAIATCSYKNFESRMRGLDSEIRKDDITKKVIDLFKATEDPVKIIKHFKEPIELEKEVFLEHYMDYQKEVAEDTSEKYEKVVVKFR